jgi:hypothetical protein
VARRKDIGGFTVDINGRLCRPGGYLSVLQVTWNESFGSNFVKVQSNVVFSDWAI